MLYWIWLAILFTVAFATAMKGYRFVENTMGQYLTEGPGLPLIAVLIGLGAIALTFPVHVVPVFLWFTEVLPNTGDYINTLTSGLLVGLLIMIGAASPVMLATGLSASEVRIEMWRRFTATDTIFKPEK